MTDIINKLQSFTDANPESIAVRHTTDELTYQQLMDESSKLAHRLQGSKKPMILFGHMSPYMIVGMIGAIKAGCGYVPVDTSIPEDRIKMIIEKVQPEFVFNTTGESFDSVVGDVFTIEDIKTSQDPVIFDSQIKDNDTVYTIFTSGSTGEPKGVQIEYASLVQFTDWMLELNKSGNEQQWLNQAPFSFDLSVMAIYPCLASGGTLNLVDKNMINKPKLLNEMLTATPINIWVSTPSFMEMCLLLPTLNEEQYGSLNEFFFCGEILPHRAAKALVSRFPSATIYNTYGPTEATVAVTSIQITQEVLDQYPTLPVGVERPGARLSTTDEGELVIEGQSVSLGYLKNDQKTAEVFNFDNGIRTYHTGDKAKFENGQWFIQGRIDFQIKLNGYRMELEEIETQLRQSEFVKEAIVVPVYKNDKVIHLIGAIVPTTEVTDNLEMTKNIKHDLKSRLPEYMIPRKFEWMEQLPLTSNGKIDRKKIAEVING
ncbi:TPA: D-alanine--poly(phosphoribitol) ligase subunit DltA [Staphylococcus argenteus]|uniref:D-alanine--poly(phosphoribitol) ligase subunit DltA n=1 Tax=Staphylococcus argenteus TaxID=985002 RepID=UPI000233FDDA|nr:D-alanine--poly(phosphoribitol) ligase subunit DltA [Staphylococcus argenteus]MBE2130343.1 D-alanine--poly(phosphoribitol) ligase subunit DltA [Staphylococcus argenteus]PNY93136.1 D-alanine--poly(phosphoribitol) ligase subunit 1 [Staphylococcus argenteus]CCE58638.1 D-alanine-D-alanyl carrier protein ligase [Staphylococcus argenteus]SUJ06733.1 D-alanine--poly(phosphoribitol) ligase subunit 1 [Staphylococcus argenteus]HDY9428348.1 D-alanine--poly(phosphoribitol) ligase subunit DltA [Staphyloc